MKIKNKLIGHKIIFNDLVNLFKDKKLPNKLLLSGKKGIGKSLIIKHFLNFIFSNDEDIKYNLKDLEIPNESKCNRLIENKSHPNIFQISLKEGKKDIEVSQIREMIKFQNTSSFNNMIKCIFIEDLENLNLSSYSALLKSLEEPSNNVYFFLIYNSETNIPDTIKSRCLEFKLSLNFNNVKIIVDNYFNEKTFEFISNDFINFYSSPSFLISLVKFFKNNDIYYNDLTIESFLSDIIKEKYYSKDQFIKDNINIFIEYFFYKNIIKTKLIPYKFKKYYYLKLSQIKRYNLDLESFFLEFEEKLLSE